MVLTWEAKLIAAATVADADAEAETNWKHKVTPDWDDLICDLYLDKGNITSLKAVMNVLAIPQHISHNAANIIHKAKHF